MKKQTLMHGSIIAAIIIAAAVGVGMVTGFSGIHPFASAGPVSDTNTGGQSGITGTTAADTEQYIQIDPIADKTTGDLLIVTGSTNLPAGTILMVQAGGDGVGYGEDTIVREGKGAVNRFSAPVDTSMLKPGLRTITVTRMVGNITKGDYRLGTLNGTATFTLKGSYRGVDTPVQPTITKDDYIRLDTIGDHTVGDQFLITGTTSLPVGTTMFWQVIQDKGTIPDSIDMTGMGIMANNAVTKGDGSANRVSLAVDLNKMAPGKYIAVVSDMKGDMATGEIRMGDLAGSARFTVK
jgi:hypothetical protein